VTRRTPTAAVAVEGTFYGEAARWVEELADGAAVVVDVGGGSGAAGCALARALPNAYVVVAHSAPGALARARARSVAGGVAERLETVECPPGDVVLDDEPADVVWARDLVPDVGTVPWSLAQAARLVRPGGLLAWADGERATRILDDDLGVGRPGLLGRLEAAAARADGERDAAVLDAAGLEPVASRTFLVDLPAPLGDDARAHVVELLRGLHAVAGDLDPEDARAVARLLDPADPCWVAARTDLFYRTSPRVLVTRRFAAGVGGKLDGTWPTPSG
jgi:hypothetical protein